MFVEKKNVVSIWLGTVTKRSELDAYVREHYDRADGEPISRFVGDAGDTWCDHDFMETNWSGRSQPLNEFLSGASYADSFLPQAEAMAEKAGMRKANASILLYDSVVKPAKWPARSPIQYLGSVPYSQPEPASPTLRSHGGIIEGRT